MDQVIKSMSVSLLVLKNKNKKSITPQMSIDHIYCTQIQTKTIVQDECKFTHVYIYFVE